MRHPRGRLQTIEAAQDRARLGHLAEFIALGRFPEHITDAPCEAGVLGTGLGVHAAQAYLSVLSIERGGILPTRI